MQVVGFICEIIKKNKLEIDPQTHARLLFADFSSPFNNIQPDLHAEKHLCNFNVNIIFSVWILDFLTNRDSGSVMCCPSNCTPPQNLIRGVFLFFLYRNDYRSTYDNRHVLTFAKESVIVSLLNDNESVVNVFVSWCNEFYP